jgi:spermidine/putrescine transport system permease protein
MGAPGRTVLAEHAEAAPAPLEAPRLGMLARIRAAGMRHEPLRGYALLSPTLAWMLACLAIPLAILLTLSFWTQNYLEFDRTFTVKNYFDFFESPVYLKLLW